MSLLHICGKIFDKIIFNALHLFFEDHKLINPCQSGFKKYDSCIKQLASISHKIYTAFDCNPSVEVRCIFLDLWYHMGKVSYFGLI